MSKNLRDELIQVAAVACAIVEDLDYGEACFSAPRPLGGARGEAVLWAVMKERHAQDSKWGPQHHSVDRWLAILMEEVGEAAQAYLEEVEGGEDT